MIEPLSTVIVLVTGAYLVLLGAASLIAPSRAGRFLLGFAGSPRKHYLELALRLLVGGAFVAAAPVSRVPEAFSAVGWLLLGTTLTLLLVPWHWHQRFAAATVPRALQWLPMIGVASLLFGGLVLWALASRGSVLY